MANYEFTQVDVFAPGPKAGNPVAVVHGADGLSSEQMQAFANWTNLSETTFLLAPEHPEADYRLRIFTPRRELPFAGHPTLGSAHAWLENGGTARGSDMVVQECGAGLVPLRRSGEDLSFEAPPLVRSGELEPEVLAEAVAALRIDPDQVLGSNWIDNGPGWLGIRLRSAQEVLDVRPDYAGMGELAVAVIGAHDVDGADGGGIPGGSADGGPVPGGAAAGGAPADFEVRAFVPGLDVNEDPVTGSANAGLAQWLLAEGVTDGNYTARQGTVLGRGGIIEVRNKSGAIWVGGRSRSVIKGSVSL
ncbi:PhzF family phenazine biosynthesis protein [Arthrobacter celericrescens]|uniref:PhzF family phenazine biosynthesis protein n=1 Tax=Arthrobacter celericrescens TaxID=2320851 RepID=UPI000EA2F953|nr:PhzF family phenazine biosynthesis protein [Arthrobacter celericrescens]